MENFKTEVVPDVVTAEPAAKLTVSIREYPWLKRLTNTRDTFLYILISSLEVLEIKFSWQAN